MIRIKEISLLSDEEYWAYRHLFGDAMLNGLWWLRTPGLDETSVAYNYNGAIFRVGYRYNSTILAVRPTLWLDMRHDPFDYSAGEKLNFLGLNWTVLDVKGNDLYVICDEVVAYRPFDSKSNVWETSELKVWLEEWIEYATLGVDDIIYGAVPFDKKPGDICRIGEYDMIVLEERDGECLMLAKDLYRRNVRFGDTNDFASSDAFKICSEFAIEIAKAVGYGNVVSHAVDLTSDDKTKGYGKVYGCSSLLTKDMYKRYKDIVDEYAVDQIWWLATPGKSDPTGHAVDCVWPDCDTGYSYSTNHSFLSIRPFCVVKTEALC